MVIRGLGRRSDRKRNTPDWRFRVLGRKMGKVPSRGVGLGHRRHHIRNRLGICYYFLFTTVVLKTYLEMIIRIGELVIANNNEDRQEITAPSLNVPILPSIDMMGEPDKAPVIDPSVNTATINPNLEDYHQHSPLTVIKRRTVISIHPSRSPNPSLRDAQSSPSR